MIDKSDIISYLYDITAQLNNIEQTLVFIHHEKEFDTSNLQEAVTELKMNINKAVEEAEYVDEEAEYAE